MYINSMLVDVVLLRRQGEKLPKHVIRLATPVRGRLSLATMPWRQIWAPHKPYEATTLARLESAAGTDSAPALPTLHSAHVRSLRDDQLVVVGIETAGEAHKELEWPQAWWCRVVKDA